MTEYTPDLFEDSRRVILFASLSDMEDCCRRADFQVDRSKRTGYVYAVEYAGQLKIGMSTDIWKRLHEHERYLRLYGRHGTLGRIGFTERIEHYRELEHHLHVRFFDTRLSHLGELFGCPFDLAVEALRITPAAPYWYERPMLAAEKRVHHKQSPRGSAARLRATLEQLFPSRRQRVTR